MDNVMFVYMKSPTGEVRKVSADPDVLTPLMAAGWHQTSAPEAPAAAEEK